MSLVFVKQVHSLRVSEVLCLFVLVCRFVLLGFWVGFQIVVFLASFLPRGIVVGRLLRLL